MPAAPPCSALTPRCAVANTATRRVAFGLAWTLATLAPALPCGADGVAAAETPAEGPARAERAPITPGVFVTEGVRLPYLRGGQGDIVIILPDSADALESWRPQVESLAEHFRAVAYLRRREVAPETSDAMTSSRAAEQASPSWTTRPPVREQLPATVDDGALRDLVVFLSSMTSWPVNVVGEGVGARLALRLALVYPERVRSLVLSAPDPRWFARNAAVGGAGAGEALPSASDTTFACRRLWRVSVPVLVVTGERDPRTFGEPSPLRCIRNLRQQRFRGVGVRPHAHDSEEFNRAVARFLERQRMTAGEP